MCSTFQKIIAYREYVVSKRNLALHRFNDAVITNDIPLIQSRYTSLMKIEQSWKEMNNIAL